MIDGWENRVRALMPTGSPGFVRLQGGVILKSVEIYEGGSSVGKCTGISQKGARHET